MADLDEEIPTERVMEGSSQVDNSRLLKYSNTYLHHLFYERFSGHGKGLSPLVGAALLLLAVLWLLHPAWLLAGSGI